ncbi:MAG TPA: aspartyl protease family protein [Pyrinomonadaceae bacterium]|nr:aspartyl protease family protein [Pyrinomonadaceae bacterium]
MKNRAILVLLVCLFCSATICTAQTASLAPRQVERAADASPVIIPFELVNRHIVIKVKVNNSAPLSFVLDTGDKFAIINLERARALGLTLQGTAQMRGAGAGSSSGAFVKDANFTVAGLSDFSQPVKLALPLSKMASRLGQDFDGIIGSDFIVQFVVEVDYQSCTLKLYDKDKFNYAGTGEVVPLKLNGGGHPIINAEVTPFGKAPIEGKFVVDLGSSLPLALYSPFVREQKLPGTESKTIRSLGIGGAGGEAKGQLGRVAEVRIGKFRINQPLTFFSEDEEGAFATSEVLGNIGSQIMNRFTVLLDYNRDRIILEPNARFAAPYDRAFTGFSLEALGADYRTFRISKILENSPASDAQLQSDDIITAVDGKPAAQFSLTSLNELFERTATYKLQVRRKDQTFTVSLTPRRMI